jgi:hypothetical protein
MTVEGQVLGTPAYMAPEQARGEGHGVDGRADVYSLGVMLYQLLTGELPFRGNTRMVLHQVLHDEPRPPRKLNDLIPRDLETVCLEAMAKEPSRRYAKAGELADDLRRYLAGEAVRARPEGSVARLWRWTRRNPKLAAVSLLAAAGLLATATVSTWFAIYETRTVNDLARINGDLETANADKDRINNDLAGEKTKVEKSLGQVRDLSARQRETLIKSARVASGSGLKLCNKGEVAEGLLWLARALEIAPPDADDVQRALRLQLAAWSQETCDLRDLRPWEKYPQSPDGKYQLRPSGDDSRLWDVAAGKFVGQVLPGSWGGVFSPDGKLLLLDLGHNNWQLREVPTGKPRGTGCRTHPPAS